MLTKVSLSYLNKQFWFFISIIDIRFWQFNVDVKTETLF